jgi:metal-responsive CopG/Arc/MetJ family transcriptional regulator
MSLVKTQVQLPKEDLEALRRVAAEEGVSVSELVRRAVKARLELSCKPSREELWERAGKVIGKYDSGVTDLAERHDDYFVEAIESWKESS